MTAIILAVGDELVSGQTVDSNSAHLARELAALGIPVVRHETLGDDCDAIARALRRAARDAEIVIASGGLGPPADDVTRQALAEALGEPLVLDENQLAAIEQFFARRGRTMIEANRVQAMAPASARLIDNRVGTAPGIRATLDEADVFIVPGVPHEMRWMFEHAIAPALPRRDGVVLHRVIHTFGRGESDIASEIHDLMARGRSPAVGTTVAAGLVSIRVVCRASSVELAEEMFAREREEICRRCGELVVGEGDATMATVVGEWLRREGHTLASAESCTGGLLGEMLTETPGASEYFLGGIVAYDNRVKRDLLGIDDALLAEHGAGSEPVALAMATAARERLGATWGIGITGIAGPGGGSEEKPVGLVFTALAGPDGALARRHVYPGDRGRVRLRSALSALNMLRLALLRAAATG